MLRFFYASSACIYPEGRQLETEVEGGGLKEEHAWPAQVLPSLALLHVYIPPTDVLNVMADNSPGGWHTLQPQDAYGLEKLASEELARHYDKDFGIECRIARFHNIYGPYGER